MYVVSMDGAVEAIKQLFFLRQTNCSSDFMWVATSASWSDSNEFGQADLIFPMAPLLLPDNNKELLTELYSDKVCVYANMSS